MDIIVLILLCIQIGRRADQKGWNAWYWRRRLVFTWLIFEFFGFLIGTMLFNIRVDKVPDFKQEGMFGLSLFAFACGFGGYLLVKYAFDKKSEKSEQDDIDQIGSDSL